MKDYETLLERLIGQLDSLISFMGISHEEVFQLLQRERTPWFGDSADQLPEAYTTYRKQIIHSALLLGYSYFESFLADMLKAIIGSRPSMLSGKRELCYRKIIEAESKDEIIDDMIKREIIDLSYKKMTEIVAELRNRYGFTITTEQETALCKASLIRNCIMHNSSCANAHLAKYDGFQEGVEFELCSSQVHDLGIILRSLVRTMASEANVNYNIRAGQSDAANLKKAK